MEKTINECKQYFENKISVWKNRFTWRRGGSDPQHKISIIKYLKKTSDFEDVVKNGVPTNSEEFFKCVNELADKYVAWACEEETTKDGKCKYTKEDNGDMHNFFVGVIGEYFFYFLMTDVKCVQCLNENNEYIRYDFRYVYPFLNKDFGIDLLGVVSSSETDQSCAIQVKFWNPYNNEKPGMEVFQKLGWEAVRRDYIDAKKDKNLFFCWLGDENKIYKSISSNKELQRSVAVIGKNSLDKTINNRNSLFWGDLFNSIIEYKNID